MRKLKNFLLGLVASAALAVGLSAQVPTVAISNLGPVYYAERYGVVCTDNTTTADAVATTNTTKINALVAIINLRTDRTGVIQLPKGQYCSFNGQIVIGSTSTTSHISFLGNGLQSTTLRWKGLNGQPTSTPAIFVSKNKYVRIGDFTLTNADGTTLSGQYDTASNIGIRFGGTASGGTQTFGVWVKQMGVSNFDTCMQWGGNADGSAASDSNIDDTSFSYCNEIMNNTGNFNTLDLHFHNLTGANNKIGIVSSTGNIDIDGGSFSYNGIDFKSTGFGYFSVRNMRSEGPGRFFYGTEPHVTLINNTIAESQGSRPLTGTVTCAPNAARSITIDFDKDVNGSGFYPITFSAGALTNADLVKTVMVQLSNGEFFQGLFRGALSSTTGQLQKVSQTSSTTANLIDDTSVPLTIYDAPTCDYVTNNATMITANDVGASIMSKGGGLVQLNSGINRIWVSTNSTTTTGGGYFYQGVGGSIPLLTTQADALSAAEGAAGNVNVGTHKYYVTFVINPTSAEQATGSGMETKGGAEGTVTVSTSAKQVSLTSIPTGPSGTIARNVYRTAAGATGITNAHLLSNGHIADNVTTTLTDNDSDSTLASGFIGDDVSRSYDINPVLMDNIVVELTTSTNQTIIENLFAHGIIKVRGGNAGGAGNIQIRNSKILAGPIGQALFPIVVTQAANDWQITAAKATIPDVASASGTIHTTGIQFPGAFSDQTSGQERTDFFLQATGNTSAIYNGFEHPLADFYGRVTHGRFEPFFYQPRAIEGSTSTGDDDFNYYASGIGIRPENQLSRVTQLSEFQNVGGKNLKTWCKFNASTTCAVAFARTESVTFNATGSDVRARDRGVRYVVTSGHFNVADLGKPFNLSVDSTALGTRTAYGWINQLEDATHIWVERSAGNISLGSQGTSYGPVNATVGQNEPDANYMVFLQCDDTAVTYKTGSLATTGFTITASGSTSATCQAIIVR